MLHAGWAFRFALLPDGRRQILGFLLPGDMISLRSLLSVRMSFSVQTLTDVTLCSFTADEFVHALKNAELCGQLVSKLMHHLTVADGRISDLGRRTALERIARLILDLEGRLRGRGLIQGDAFDFPLRQTHIGDALGLTTVHVSRTFATLRDLDIVTLQRKTISIINRKKLCAILGEATLL
jgi:CRP-like cAMP-binding protein